MLNRGLARLLSIVVITGMMLQMLVVAGEVVRAADATGDYPVFDLQAFIDDKPVTQFASHNPVTVTIPYKPQPGVDLNQLVVYHHHSRIRGWHLPAWTHNIPPGDGGHG